MGGPGPPIPGDQEKNTKKKKRTRIQVVANDGLGPEKDSRIGKRVAF